MKEQEGKCSLQGGAGVKEEAAFLFAELLDYLITDVATEAHRAARLGFDYRLDVEEEEEARLSAQARAAAGDASFSGAESNGKYTVDVFGQSHPVIANEAFDCMNCGRSIVAGRFAPHLEKCMGKGRRARLKTTKTTTILLPQQKRARSSPGSSHAAAALPLAITGSRSYSKVQMTKEVSQRSLAELNDDTFDDAHEDEDKDISYGRVHPVRSRSKKTSGAYSSADRAGTRNVGQYQQQQQQHDSSPLVPVPVDISPPTKAWNSASSRLEGAALRSQNGTVQGLAVEVDVETINPLASLRVPNSIYQPASKASRVGPQKRVRSGDL